jgi:hypothetical protein
MKTVKVIEAIEPENNPLLDDGSVRLLESVRSNPTFSVVEHYHTAQLSAASGTETKTQLLNTELLTQQEMRNKEGRKIILGLTKKGVFYSRLQTSKPIVASNASIEHLYYQHEIATKLENAGYSIKIEPQLNDCRPDILVNDTVAIEIETGKSKHWLQHIRTHLNAKRSLIIVATNQQTFDFIESELRRQHLYPHDSIRVVQSRL